MVEITLPRSVPDEQCPKDWQKKPYRHSENFFFEHRYGATTDDEFAAELIKQVRESRGAGTELLAAVGGAFDIIELDIDDNC